MEKIFKFFSLGQALTEKEKKLEEQIECNKREILKFKTKIEASGDGVMQSLLGGMQKHD